MKADERTPGVAGTAPPAGAPVPQPEQSGSTYSRWLRLLQPLALASILIHFGAAPAVAAAGNTHAEKVRFAWAFPGSPAVLDFPLPEGVPAGRLEGVTTPSGVRLLGFSVEGEPPHVALYLTLVDGTSEVTFDSVGLELAQVHAQQSLDVGQVRLVEADSAPGPLRFVRSLVAPGAGLYLAVTLQNDGNEALRLTAVEYLLPGATAGRLLFAAGSNSQELLTALERSQLARGRTGADRPEREEAVPEGFSSFLPEEADIVLEPGNAAVLVWTEQAFAADQREIAYELQPVIVYTSSSAPGQLRRLGLPTLLRTQP